MGPCDWPGAINRRGLVNRRGLGRWAGVGKYAAGAAAAGTSRGLRGGTWVGLGGDGYGRLTESALRQEAWQEARFAQPRPWSSRGLRGVQIARCARVRDPTIIGPRARTVARPDNGTPARYRAPGAQERSLDIVSLCRACIGVRSTIGRVPRVHRRPIYDQSDQRSVQSRVWIGVQTLLASAWTWIRRQMAAWRRRGVDRE